MIFKITDLFSNRFHSDTFSLLQKENIQHLQFQKFKPTLSIPTSNHDCLKWALKNEVKIWNGATLSLSSYLHNKLSHLFLSIFFVFLNRNQEAVNQVSLWLLVNTFWYLYGYWILHAGKFFLNHHVMIKTLKREHKIQIQM